MAEKDAKSEEHEAGSKPEMLTPEEIESLRQNSKRNRVYARKAFARLRPKKVEPG